MLVRVHWRTTTMRNLIILEYSITQELTGTDEKYIRHANAYARRTITQIQGKIQINGGIV